MKFEIAGHKLGPDHPCFIIAEAGVNHNGDLDTALRLIDAAAEARANAVKFQTFSTDRLVTRQAPKAAYQKQTTDSRESQYEMLKRLQFTEAQFRELKKYCDTKQILFLSTASDEESVDIVTRLNVAAYKIASSDITQLPLLRYIAKKKRPIILSTGTATVDEIDEAVNAIRSRGNNKIILLQCVSQYPVSYREANINAMCTLRERFNCLVGYSGHEVGLQITIGAVALCASSVERHITLSRSMWGSDQAASLGKSGLQRLVRDCRIVSKALGDGAKRVLPCEEMKRKSLRSPSFRHEQDQQG